MQTAFEYSIENSQIDTTDLGSISLPYEKKSGDSLFVSANPYEEGRAARLRLVGRKR